MPHAILHAMGVFAASITYMRIRERGNNYIFMNPGRGNVRGGRGGRPLGELRRATESRREEHRSKSRPRTAARGGDDDSSIVFLR